MSTCNLLHARIPAAAPAQRGTRCRSRRCTRWLARPAATAAPERASHYATSNGAGPLPSAVTVAAPPTEASSTTDRGFPPHSSSTGGAAAVPAFGAVAPAAEPIPVTITGGMVPVQALLSPANVYEACASMGAYKASMPWWKNLALAVAAGVYTAMFTSLLLMVGPNCHGLAASNPGLARYLTGAIGLPFQLMVIMICGAELFTGSTAMVTAAVYEGKTSLAQLLRQWAGSYLGNMLGCALGVALLLNSGAVPYLQAGISSISAAKLALPLKQTFVKGILANWFVCLAVWQATAAQTVGGKFISILGPLSAFIAVGFEHAIANAVIIPLGILTGVPGVTWDAFLLRNLLPVTLGNILAGVVCVASLYSLAYGALGKRVARALGEGSA